MKKQAKQSKSATAKAGPGPVPSDDPQERIRQRAYELWVQGGYEHGRDVEYWLRAEHELLGGRSDKPVPPVS